MNVGIYARVSKKDQHCELQLFDMRRQVAREDGWEAVEYIEKASSVKKRPVFEKMLEDARAGKIDVVLVWRIDRFARSMKDFVEITLELKSWKVRLLSCTEKVDTGDENPFSKFMIQLLAILAELERNIIVARVHAGLDEAKRQGKHCGRPKKVFKRDRAMELRAQGMSWRKIAAELGVDFSTVRRALAA